MKGSSLLLLVGFACLFACAHVRPTGSTGLVGQIVDESGSSLAGVTVQLVGEGDLERQELTTDSQGGFTLSGLADGAGRPIPLRAHQPLKLRAWRAGFVPIEQKLDYPGGRVVLQPIVLQPDRLEVDPGEAPNVAGQEEDAVESAGASRSGRGE